MQLPDVLGRILDLDDVDLEAVPGLVVPDLVPQGGAGGQLLGVDGAAVEVGVQAGKLNVWKKVKVMIWG